MVTTNSVNTYIVPTTNNEVTMPSQPAFLAYLSSTQTDKSGDGAVYDIIFDTEVFDQNNDYNTTTGVFTAPVTGRYYFAAQVSWIDCTISVDVGLNVNTSNRIYAFYNVKSASDHNIGIPGTHLCDMDVGDTRYVYSIVNGEAADTCDLLGTSPNINTGFSMSLIC